MKKWIAFLFLAPCGTAAAQQPAAPIQVDAPNVPGGKVVLVPRDQLRASPGTKTLRLPHPVRAALSANEKDAIAPPAAFDWATKDGKRAALPMLGNDRYGDCYYVAPAKVHILFQWQVQGTQLAFDEKALITRYLKISGGDNGLSDSQVFPEMKAGIVGPNGPYKSLDELIVPASDKAAIKLAAWAFGPPMFTFTVYENFMHVAPGGVMTGNSGRVVGGHAVLFSGLNADGSWNGETWGFARPFVATPQWVTGVEPEFVATFSLRWFDAKGFAPNGLHYTTLAPLWNSMGGSVPVPGPFPPPDVPPVDPPGKGFTGDVNVVVTFVDGKPTGVKLGGGGAKVDPAAVEKAVRGELEKAFPGVRAIGGVDWNTLIAAIVKAVIEALLKSHQTAAYPRTNPADGGSWYDVGFGWVLKP